VRLINVEISAVLLFGVLTALLIRYAGLKLSYALVAALFGFFLAASPVASTVNQVANAISTALTGG
jgi:intracellular septation protein A